MLEKGGEWGRAQEAGMESEDWGGVKVGGERWEGHRGVVIEEEEKKKHKEREKKFYYGGGGQRRREKGEVAP